MSSSGETSTFALSTEEQAVPGLLLSNDRLIVYPTTAAKVLSALFAVIGAGLLIAGLIVVLVDFSGWAIFLLTAGVYNLAIGWRCFTARVSADTDAITIRNHWRTHRVPWKDVMSVDLEEIRKSWGWLPYSTFGGMPHRFVAGVVRTRDGQVIPADAAVSLPGNTLGFGQVPPSRVKVDALSRWRGQRPAGGPLQGPAS